MEKRPALKWDKEENHSTGDVTYTLKISGYDEDKRSYFYLGQIFKMVDYKDKLIYTYNAEYKLFTDGNNFKLQPIKDKKDNISTLEEAKKWIEEAFKKQWELDHSDKEKDADEIDR